jgi:iron(III) transport system substrate-binding protein
MRRHQTVAVAAAFLAVATACSSSPLQDDTNGAGESSAADDLEVYEKYADMAEPDRTDELVKQAQEEGSLNLYGTSTLGELGQEFTKKYGVETRLFEGSTDEVAARLIQEDKGGKHIADVTDGGATFLNKLDEMGLLGTYESPVRDDLPPEAVGEHWTAQQRYPFVVAYNTDEVDPSEIPDDYLDFADSKWDGKISMELGDYDWYMGVVQHYEASGMSREAVDATLQQIASNAVVVDGHSDQMELLAAGQFAVTLSSYVHHVEELKADGAPIDWAGSGVPPVAPTVMRYEGDALLSQAPHPAAATLFMDFVLGPEVRQELADTYYLPALPEADDPLDGIRVEPLDLDEYAAHSAQWSADYDVLLRNAEH